MSRIKSRQCKTVCLWSLTCTFYWTDLTNFCSRRCWPGKAVGPVYVFVSSVCLCACRPVGRKWNGGLRFVKKWKMGGAFFVKTSGKWGVFFCKKSGHFLNAGWIMYSISIFYFTFYLFGGCVRTQRTPSTYGPGLAKNFGSLVPTRPQPKRTASAVLARITSR